jgi:DNA-binding response OmpR family regulator
MHTPPRILIVDDQPQNVDVLQDRLEGQGYEILTATAGEAALTIAIEKQPDLILLDVLMPGMDGIEVCRRLKADRSLPFMPVIMVTAKSGNQDIVAGFEAGADEYLTKPLDQAALIARVKSMLRLKSFHDEARGQATESEAEAAALEQWNETLEDRIQEQMIALERMGLLKRFLPPQLAEWVLSLDDAEPLMIQRREVTVLCCALQGFTTFVDTTEPERVFGLLRDYHKLIGPLMTQFGGNLERFAGDELLVVFNAPLTCDESILRAVGLATKMRQQLNKLTERWRSDGYVLDFGIGVAHGDATLGMVDLEGQWDYAVMGSVRHLASRLSETAQTGKILVSQSVWKGMEERIQAHPAGELALHRQMDPIPVFEVIGVKTSNREVSTPNLQGGASRHA